MGHRSEACPISGRNRRIRRCACLSAVEELPDQVAAGDRLDAIEFLDAAQRGVRIVLDDPLDVGMVHLLREVAIAGLPDARRRQNGQPVRCEAVALLPRCETWQMTAAPW